MSNKEEQHSDYQQRNQSEVAPSVWLSEQPRAQQQHVQRR